MNQNDIKNLPAHDANLREAISRREQKLPQMPADLNARVMGLPPNPSPVERGDKKAPPTRRGLVGGLFAIGAVAASVVLLFSLNVVLSNQNADGSDYVAQTDTLKTIPQTETNKENKNLLEEKENKQVADTMNRVKQIILISKTPRHYLAKQETPKSSRDETSPRARTEGGASPSANTDPIDDTENLDLKAMRHIEMEMMARTNGSLQADYEEMTREIRQRGERMTRQVEIAINDDAY